VATLYRFYGTTDLLIRLNVTLLPFADIASARIYVTTDASSCGKLCAVLLGHVPKTKARLEFRASVQTTNRTHPSIERRLAGAREAQRLGHLGSPNLNPGARVELGRAGDEETHPPVDKHGAHGA
jgi:hypothetical protein